jgi:hypothetical protein
MVGEESQNISQGVRHPGHPVDAFNTKMLSDLGSPKKLCSELATAHGTVLLTESTKSLKE